MAFFSGRWNLCNSITSYSSKKKPFNFNASLYIFYNHSRKNDLGKRTSLPIPSLEHTWQKGSITVETAFVLPFFLFFVINLLSIIQILTCYSKVEAVLHQTAKKMSVYASLFQQEGKESQELESIIEQAYVMHEMRTKIGEQYWKRSPVVNGAMGLDFSYSSVPDEEECIDLVVNYRVRPAVSLLGFGEFRMLNRCRMRIWTGYNNHWGINETAEGEQIVYITEDGEVYHPSSQCTHLKLSITKVGVSYIKKLKNDNGSSYSSCELCGDQPVSGMYYITEQGEKYHSRIRCSGLKRQVIAVPISEAEGRPVCSRCGG